MLISSRSVFADNGLPDSLSSHTGATLTSGISGDSCLLCHWQSGPDISFQTGQLCFQCHTDIAQKDRKLLRHVEVVNEKFPGLSCEGCHRLHEAAGDPLLLDDQTELCVSCHRESSRNKSHPVVEYLDIFGRRSPVIGNDGRLVTCGSHCHDVHGADFEYLCRLAPGRELCLSCHEEFK